MDFLEQEQNTQEPNAPIQAAPAALIEAEQDDELNAWEQEANALDYELAQSEATLESDIAKTIAARIESDENGRAADGVDYEELFLDNKEEFFKRIFAMQNEVLKARYTDKIARKNELDDLISNRRAVLDFDKEIQAFQKESGENVAELMGFYENELSKNEQKQIENLPPQEFFKELVKMRDSKATKEAPKPPKMLKGAEKEARSFSYDSMANPLEREW